jgi:hypothetical protein
MSFCKKTSILKRDCPCETCRYNRVVRGGIIKNNYRQEQQPQTQQGTAELYKEPPVSGAPPVSGSQPLSGAPPVSGSQPLSGAPQEQGEDDGGWVDYDNAGVFENESDDGGWETVGGKRKRKRKQRFTRRLRRRNHNTKKSKIVKRKITKHSRKNKYKLK